MNISSYMGQVNSAIRSRDGRNLRELFKLDSDATLLAMQIARRGGGAPVNEIGSRLRPPWPDVVVPYVQALVHIVRGERLEAVKEFREKHCKALLEMLNEEVWVLPAVVGSAVTLKTLSAQVDDGVLKQGGTTSNSQLATCAMSLQQMFSKTAAARGQGEDVEIRRAAAVAIGCVMFKVYFRLNTITNCKNVTSTIDNVLRNFHNAEAAHRVTYRYYTGRLLTYDEKFQQADEHLSYAFNNCHPQAHQNRKRILRYLIPVRMLLGVLPTEGLLAQYRLPEYTDVASAVRSGNIGLLMRALNTHQLAFVQAGTYLLLEKLQLAAYRRLFKKVALVHALSQPGPKACQIPIALFQRALELQGIVKDDVELQCLLANLIFRKFIKGYIAYRQQVVVIAKTDAFPSLAAAQLADPFS